ncbi:hypothetical protein [Methyloligella solikamskensis]|uniref:Transmembrane anchored protein n=1 Tax=Methyloligella solikamskensis TaxID=1177756 RepID=A0ABW3JBS1_9HYPH
MRTLIFAALLAALSATAISTSAIAGPCNVPSDRASDGSRCGDRAASERPGGN